MAADCSTARVLYSCTHVSEKCSLFLVQVRPQWTVYQLYSWANLQLDWFAGDRVSHRGQFLRYDASLPVDPTEDVHSLNWFQSQWSFVAHRQELQTMKETDELENKSNCFLHLMSFLRIPHQLLHSELYVADFLGLERQRKSHKIIIR